MNEQLNFEESTLDLRDIIRAIKKRRWLILFVFLVSVLSTLVICYLIPPTYQAETILRIKQPKGLADSLLAEVPMGDVMQNKTLMSTYAEILKSRTVIQTVIEKTQTGKTHVPSYEEMTKIINTQPVKDTELLKVTAQARTPLEAQLIANTVVETFMDRLTYLVRDEQKTVGDFIKGRLDESKVELEKDEDNLENYKRDQQIAAPDEETKAMVDELSSMNKLSAENTVEIATAQAKLGSVQQQLGKEKPGFIADSPLIQQYRSKLADLEVQLATLSQNYTDKHPQVLATRAAIDETRQKLNTEIARVINSEAPSMNPIHQSLMQTQIQAQAEIAAASAQKEAISRIVTKHQQELSKLPEKEHGLAQVMRDASVAQELYIMLAKRYEEARISEVMQPTDVQVIDTAVAPDPHKPIAPKKSLNVLIAAFLGLFAGTCMAMVLDYLNKTIANADDVKHYLALPVLGNIPDFDKGELKKRGIWGKK